MMEKKLNHLLADMVVEYHKLQNFHWYVKGGDFFQIHTKLEEYYDQINLNIDEVAENILMIGGKPIASLVAFAEEATIKEASAEYRTSSQIMQEVISDYEYLLDEVREIKSLADEEGNPLVSALMDTYISQFIQALWMMKQQQMA